MERYNCWQNLHYLRGWRSCTSVGCAKKWHQHHTHTHDEEKKAVKNVGFRIVGPVIFSVPQYAF